MQIHWEIVKKRGNLRPMLTYSFAVEPWEREMAIPPIRISSTIPKPEESFAEFCYPGQHERAAGYSSSGRPTYELEIVSHKGKLWPQSLRLPWREDNSYPEVEESFARLRDAVERESAMASRSEPLRLEGSLDCRAGRRSGMAAAVLADKFLAYADRFGGA